MLCWALIAAMPFVQPMGAAPAIVLVIAYFVALLASYALVGCWIYRTNANAHAFGGGMTMEPGWAVGWFFVPIASLFMPYEGVKETWEASHRMAGNYRDMEDYWLLRWWWGLWLTSNILPPLAGLFLGDDPDASLRPVLLNLLTAGLHIGCGLVLILLMRSIGRAQLAASRGSVFA
jgi:hypothetical protein